MNENYQQHIHDAIQHLKHGPIIPAGQPRITRRYTCPKCRAHAGTKMRSTIYWPPNTEIRCGWCRHTYSIPN